VWAVAARAKNFALRRRVAELVERQWGIRPRRDSELKKNIISITLAIGVTAPTRLALGLETQRIVPYCYPQ
jgi:hypothetical protein